MEILFSICVYKHLFLEQTQFGIWLIVIIARKLLQNFSTAVEMFFSRAQFVQNSFGTFDEMLFD